MPINYSIGHSCLGAIMVATNERGICALEFGSDVGVLVNSMALDAAATNQLVLAQDKSLLAKVCRQIAEPQVDLKLPLDISGSKFQKKVWNELRKIAVGSTISYSDLALRLKSGARAVGNACGANRIAVLIPCHRVIAKDGKLGGYKGGLAIKKQLLELEVAKTK